MLRISALLLLLLTVVPLWARDNSSAWIEVRSEHFTVVTNAGEKQGRHVIDQFERMRWVFQTMFPKMNVDPVSPIEVLALKSEKDFRALEPAAYLGKGKLNLAGYFLRAPDKNFIMLRLDANDADHPYATVYHEYTHLEIGDAIEWMPLWLNEGLAEFFQNTELEEKTARLGEPSPDDLLYLRQHQLIPLETLFRVDANSPYYHEEQKGSVFYAESWALTHLLETSDAMHHTNRLQTYVELVSQHQDPVAAAQKAFGDLGKLQEALQDYTSRASYQYFRLPTPPLNEGAFTVEAITEPQADAVRADFLAYNGRTGDARTILEGVLKADANNLQAHETMGYLAFREGNLGEAKKWYAEAVALDSQSFLAQYYFAALSLMDGTTDAQVEASLRTAIRLNPRFAPAYDALAGLYGRRRENLDEAHMLSVQAVSLEPANLNYRIDCANLLMEQERFDDSIRVLEAAKEVAKTPQQEEIVASRIGQVQLLQGEAEREKAQRAEIAATQGMVRVMKGTDAVSGGGSGDTALPQPKHPTETPHGKMLTFWGTIHGVTCSYPAVMELQVTGAKGKLDLYNNNYYKVEYSYSRAGATPEGELHPCQDLEGSKAEVEYFRTADKTVDGQIVAVMLVK